MNAINTFFRKKIKYLIPVLLALPSIFLTNCNKGHVEIIDITDSIENCALPYVVYFYPVADIGNGETSYHWDFGDGTLSQERAPVHVYDKTGLYTVTLKIRNNETEDVKSMKLDLQAENIPIVPNFEWAFYGSGLYAPAKISLTNYSSHATSYHWDFGDGYEAEGVENPEHEYTHPGTYTLSLGAICNGDTAFQSETFEIKEAPNDIMVRDVRVWLPPEFLGANIFCDMLLNGRLIKTSPVAIDISGYPVILPVNDYILNFDYNNDVITFHVYDEAAPQVGNEIYTFEAFTSQIQNDYYPYTLFWGDGSEFSAEADIEYEIDIKSEKSNK